ncbi:hypothetical protein H1R20_g14571, partial [Candolleomyces eurysporus]
MPVYTPPFRVRLSRLQALRTCVLEAQKTPHDPTLRPAIYEWDSESNNLGYWHWPAYPCGRRVPPDELEQYMLNHYCLAPCCLCAYVDNKRYAASKISMVEAINENKESQRLRPYIGEYIAECAQEDSCGYFVLIERFYAQKTLMTSIYRKRDKPLDPKMWDFMKDEKELNESKRRASGFRRMMAGKSSEDVTRGYNRLKRTYAEFSEDVVAVNALFHTLEFDGLEASKFWELFVECAKCEHIMPRNLYPYSHQCSKKTRDGAGFDQQNTGLDTVEELREVIRNATGEDASNMELDDILDWFKDYFPDDPQDPVRPRRVSTR